jgi:hypothetical protein
MRFQELILKENPFGVPDSNVQITFNLVKSFVESAKTCLFVDPIKFCITFATQTNENSFSKYELVALYDKRCGQLIYLR